MNTRGAVTVETLLVLVPFFSVFFTLVQAVELFTADLVLRHATVAATRAAIVILDDGHTNPGHNGPNSDVVNAAGLAMGPWLSEDRFEDVRVTWTDASSRSAPSGRVTVTVTAAYRCRIPLGNLLVCGGTTRVLTFTSSLPHQGARYRT